MATYVDEESAAAAGFHIVHEAAAHRFALYQDPSHESGGESPTLIGEAHYTPLGADAVDFDHTVVSPAFRGTGLSALLAHHAITSDVARGRRIHASCWYIEKYLTEHPELVHDADA